MGADPRSDVIAIQLDDRFRNRGVIVVSLDGSLNTFSSVSVIKVLEPELFVRFRHFVFDFGKLSFIDSIGLSAMVTIFKRIDREGGTLRVINVSDAVRTVFEITKIIRKIPIAADLESALREVAAVEGGIPDVPTA